MHGNLMLSAALVATGAATALILLHAAADLVRRRRLAVLARDKQA